MRKGQAEMAMMVVVAGIVAAIIGVVILGSILDPLSNDPLATVTNESITLTNGSATGLSAGGGNFLRTIQLQNTTVILSFSATDSAPDFNADNDSMTVTATNAAGAFNASYTYRSDTFVGGTLATILSNITILFSLGVLFLGGTWLFLRK